MEFAFVQTSPLLLNHVTISPKPNEKNREINKELTLLIVKWH